MDLVLGHACKVDAVADVLANTVGEKDGLLLDESDLALVVPSSVDVFQIAAFKE